MFDEVGLSPVAPHTERIKINPLSPHDTSNHHFTSLQTYLIVLHTWVLNENFHETVFSICDNFL